MVIIILNWLNNLGIELYSSDCILHYFILQLHGLELSNYDGLVLNEELTNINIVRT